jgi:hypothetical protein
MLLEAVSLSLADGVNGRGALPPCCGTLVLDSISGNESYQNVEGSIQYQWQLPVFERFIDILSNEFVMNVFIYAMNVTRWFVTAPYTVVCLWIHITIYEYNWSCCQISIHICHYQQETVSWKQQNSQSQRKQVHNVCKRANFCYTKQEVKKKKK